MNDKELYAECKRWGSASLAARWKFIGLLPEVMCREMKAQAKGKSWLDRRGYQGIKMFAAKLAGVSEGQVELALNLDKRFEELPLLRALLTKGEVSINKLVRIVSIATKVNQKELIEKVTTLSNRALEQYVKDQKNEDENDLEIKKSQKKVLHVQEQITIERESVKPQRIEPKPEPAQLPKITTLQLDSDIEKQLIELQEKGIDINGLLRQFLKEREEKIEQKMEEVADQLPETTESRYRPVPVEEVVHEKYGTKCSELGCTKPAEHMHHEKPFAKHKTHDPRWLRPLCKAHHELAHHNDPQVQKFRQLALSDR